MSDKPLAKLEPSIESIIATAVHEKLPVAELRELLALKRDMQADRAKQAFIRAMAEFQAMCPRIPRKHKADFATSSGRMTYDYASLEDVVAVIDPVLKPLGLYYRWPSASEEGGRLTVTCEVSHVEGHSEVSSYVVPVESKSAASPQQKFGSAGTYCKRQVLIMALALGTVDPDDDGRGDQPVEAITEDQARQLEDLLHQLHEPKRIETKRRKLLEYIEAKALSDCPKSEFDYIVNNLQETIAAADLDRAAAKDAEA